ncbi:MAG: hypothetical protein ACRENE_04025 [Polyangiaceae bacterium]
MMNATSLSETVPSTHDERPRDDHALDGTHSTLRAETLELGHGLATLARKVIVFADEHQRRHGLEKRRRHGTDDRAGVRGA